MRHWIAGTHTGPVLSRHGFSHPPLFPCLNQLIPGAATDRAMLRSRIGCRWLSPVKLGSVLVDVEQREALRRRSRNSGRVSRNASNRLYVSCLVLSLSRLFPQIVPRANCKSLTRFDMFTGNLECIFGCGPIDARPRVVARVGPLQEPGTRFVRVVEHLRATRSTPVGASPQVRVRDRALPDHPWQQHTTTR